MLLHSDYLPISVGTIKMCFSLLWSGSGVGLQTVLNCVKTRQFFTGSVTVEKVCAKCCCVIIIYHQYRKRLLNCYVFSVLKYDCESWTVNKNLMKRINTFEQWSQWCYRMMLKISWKNKVPNTEVLKRVGEKEQQFSMENVQQKKAYAGHVLRGSSGRNALVIY